MVRIHARQPFEDEALTRDFEIGQNLSRPFLGHFFNQKMGVLDRLAQGPIRVAGQLVCSHPGS